MNNQGFFARLAALWRGFWGVKINDAEARHAEAVYHQAIEQRTDQHRKLKDAVGRLVYLRNKIDVSLQQRRSDLAVVEQRLITTLAQDEDAKALALVRRKREFTTEIQRLEVELARVSDQAEEAKGALGELGATLTRLKAERTEMLARKQHALARLEIASAIQQASGTFGQTDRALDNVREAISRLEYRADIGSEEEFAESGDLSMAQLHRELEEDADLAELDRLRARLAQPRLENLGMDSNPDLPVSAENPS